MRTQQNSALIDDLARRVAVLEGKDANKHTCDHKPAHDRRVEVLHAMWRTRVLTHLSQPLRKLPTVRNLPFTSAVHAHTLGFSEDFAYEDFVHAVKHAASQPEEDVSFFPSYRALTDPRLDINEGYIVFSTARAVLNWLGVTSSHDVRALLVRSQKLRDGIDVTRVLGGAQCNKDSVDDPVRVFIGRSCTARRRAREVSEEKAYAVEFNSAKWDDSNNKLCAEPKWSEEYVGDYKHARDWESVFSLGWTWKGGYDGRAVSEHGKRMGTVRLGNLALTLPAVSFRGNDLCKKVDKYLAEHVR